MNNTRNAEGPFHLPALARLYQEHYNLSETPNSIYKRIHQISRKITQREHFQVLDVPLNEKVRIVVGLSAKLDKNFEARLRKQANVTVIDQRIVEYEAHDGSLSLKIDHDIRDKRVLTMSEAIFKDEALGMYFCRRPRGKKNAEEDEASDDDTGNYEDVEEEEDSFDELEMKNEKKGNRSQSTEFFTPPNTFGKRRFEVLSSIPKRQKIGVNNSTSSMEETNFNGEIVGGHTVGTPLMFSSVKQEPQSDFSFTAMNTSENEHRESQTNLMGNSNTVNLVDILEVFKTISEVLEQPILDDLQKSIEIKIKALENSILMIPRSSLVNALKSILDIVTKPAIFRTPGESFTSLKDFLLILRTSTNVFKFDELNGFRESMKHFSRESQNQDMGVSIERIRNGLGYALETILS